MNLKTTARTAGFFCAAALALLLLAAGCSPKPSRADLDGAAPKPAPAEAPPAKPVVNIGDAESSILVIAKAAPEAASPTVQVEEVNTARHRLAMVNINVRPPWPATLPIQVTIESQVSFEERPVVLRGGPVRDDTPLPAQQPLLVQQPLRKGAADPVQYTFNALEGLAQPPETMLLVVKLDAFMLDSAAQAAGLDPATFTSETRTLLMSNPVRVNFLKE